MKRPTIGTKFVFFQEPDCCSIDGQELVAEMCDGGNGMFVRISTQGWALDVEDLRKFIGRLKWCVKQCEQINKEEQKV